MSPGCTPAAFHSRRSRLEPAQAIGRRARRRASCSTRIRSAGMVSISSFQNRRSASIRLGSPSGEVDRPRSEKGAARVETKRSKPVEKVRAFLLRFRLQLEPEQNRPRLLGDGEDGPAAPVVPPVLAAGWTSGASGVRMTNAAAGSTPLPASGAPGAPVRGTGRSSRRASRMVPTPASPTHRIGTARRGSATWTSIEAVREPSPSSPVVPDRREIPAAPSRRAGPRHRMRRADRRPGPRASGTPPGLPPRRTRPRCDRRPPPPLHPRGPTDGEAGDGPPREGSVPPAGARRPGWGRRPDRSRQPGPYPVRAASPPDWQATPGGRKPATDYSEVTAAAIVSRIASTSMRWWAYSSGTLPDCPKWSTPSG